MNNNDFYMILVSNSSMEYFPDNTATKFRTYLPHDVRLTGTWTVGPTEIQYPCSLLHIRSDDSHVVFVRGDETNEEFKNDGPHILPYGNYENLDHLLRGLNHLPEVGNHILFESKKQDHGYVRMYRVCENNEKRRDHMHLLRLSPKLLDILGFNPNLIGANGFGFGENAKIISELPASLARAFPDRLYIYCDLCGPYVTGDVQTSLLRIAPFDGYDYKYGSTRTVTFSSPNYIPLLEFDLGWRGEQTCFSELRYCLAPIQKLSRYNTRTSLQESHRCLLYVVL